MTTATDERPQSVVKREMEEAIGQMNAALKTKFDKIAQLHTEADTTEIMSRHAIGGEVMRLAGKDGEHKYGANAVALVAAGLGIGTSDLYSYQNIARAWSKEELTDMLRQARKSGMVLGYTHLSKLCGLDAADRKKLARRCIAELMTVSDLTREIQAIRGHAGNNPGGRPMIEPRTPTAGLLQLTTLTDSFVRREKPFTKGIFDKLEVLTAPEWDKKTLQEARKADEKLAVGLETTQRMRDRLKAIITAGEKAMKNRIQRRAQKTADAAGKTQTSTAAQKAAQRKKRRESASGDWLPSSKKPKKKKRALAKA